MSLCSSQAAFRHSHHHHQQKHQQHQRAVLSGSEPRALEPIELAVPALRLEQLLARPVVVALRRLLAALPRLLPLLEQRSHPAERQERDKGF